MRKADIYYGEVPAGTLTEDDDGYHFIYLKSWLSRNGSGSISLTLPLQEAPFESPTLFPFFDGLIPEGWLLKIAESNWKLNERDRMGLLLQCCRDCIGAVSVRIPGDEPDE